MLFYPLLFLVTLSPLCHTAVVPISILPTRPSVTKSPARPVVTKSPTQPVVTKSEQAFVFQGPELALKYLPLKPPFLMTVLLKWYVRVPGSNSVLHTKIINWDARGGIDGGRGGEGQDMDHQCNDWSTLSIKAEFYSLPNSSCIRFARDDANMRSFLDNTTIFLCIPGDEVENITAVVRSHADQGIWFAGVGEPRPIGSRCSTNGEGRPDEGRPDEGRPDEGRPDEEPETETGTGATRAAGTTTTEETRAAGTTTTEETTAAWTTTTEETRAAGTTTTEETTALRTSRAITAPLDDFRTPAEHAIPADLTPSKDCGEMVTLSSWITWLLVVPSLAAGAIMVTAIHLTINRCWANGCVRWRSLLAAVKNKRKDVKPPFSMTGGQHRKISRSDSEPTLCSSMSTLSGH